MKLFLDLKYFFFGFTSRTYLIIKEFKLNKSLNYVWGMKHSGLHLRKKKGKASPAYLEDGFIHSFGHVKSIIPFSICFDKNGIFYKFNSNSDLFGYLNDDLSQEQLNRSRKIIKLWREYSISKYNFPDFIEPPSGKYILLIDQIYGDLSIYYGNARKDSFKEMFDFACKNWPEYQIIIKVHPDVINSKKNGCLDRDYYKMKNVFVISNLGQINKLIEYSAAVCVVTSQVGFEALIYGKEVHVFGRPFYSDLGLTIDHTDNNKDKKNHLSVNLEQLVYAVFVRYQIFLDPRTKRLCGVEEIMQYVHYLRKVSNFFPNNFEAINLTPWKARQINRFVCKISRVRVKSLRRFKNNKQNIIIWGKNKRMDKYISKVNNCISVEDGFVRSVGLGGELYPPLSLLFDKKGIHYDASRESDLEDLLQNSNVSNDEKIRSRKIIDLIIKSKISKYNLRLTEEINLPKHSVNKEIICVLGQVETDNSIIYGVPKNTIPKTNFALVENVRKDFPDAYIIYKPHPDVEAGLRVKGSGDALIYKNADLIAYETSLEDLFKKVDRIAVFTSLGGFEALIRGISVITYGLPFYAGWGLTDDKLKNHPWAKRRTKRLTIEELTFIALIKYPLYSSINFNCLTEIENIIDEIISLNMKKNLEQIIFKYWGFLKDQFLTITTK